MRTPTGVTAKDAQAVDVCSSKCSVVFEIDGDHVGFWYLDDTFRLSSDGSGHTDEAVRFDRTSREDQRRCSRNIYPTREQLFDQQLAWTIDDYSEGAINVMMQHVNDRLLKVALTNRRGSNKQLSCRCFARH